MIDSVLFDLDGTLWDATPGITVVWNRVLEENGFSRRLTHADVCSYMGMPLVDICRSILPQANENEQRELLALITAAETECGLSRESVEQGYVRLYEGVKETLEELSRKRPLFIVSNCGIGYIESFLETFSLESYIRDHECYGATGMPKSYNIREIVRRHNLLYPVYVGDTLGDERAAEDAAVPFIHAAYGFGRALDPAAVLPDIRELPRLLQTL